MINWKLLKIPLLLLSYLTIGIISVRDYIFSHGVLGFSHDWNIPALKYQMIDRMSSSFYFWNDIYSISKIYPTYFYERLLFEFPICIFLNFNGELFSKFLIVVLITIAGISMFYLGKCFKFSNKTSYLMGLFYVLTPLIYNKVIAGHHFYLFAYSIAPLFLFFLHKYIHSKKIAYIIGSGLIIGISSAQIQFLLMLILIGLIYLLLEFKNFTIKRYILSMSSLFIIPIFLNAFWIIPNILNFHSELTTLPLKGATLDYYEIQHATQLPTAFEMIGYNHPYDLYYLFKESELSPAIIVLMMILIIFTILGAVTNFHRTSNKKLMIFSLILLSVGLFFVTAVNGPLPTLWETIYINIPFISMFREVYHSMFIIVFAYSILIGVSIEGIQKKFKSSIFRGGIFAVILVLILLSGLPILNSYMNQLQVQSSTSEEVETYNYIRDESEPSRIIYTPGIAPIKFTNLEKPFIDYMIDYSPKPTFPQTVTRTNPLECISQYYFLNAIQSPGKINSLNKLIARLGVKYLICKTDYSSFYPDYVSMQQYLTDINGDVSTYTNWKNTYLVYNNLLNYVETVKNFGTNYILTIEKTKPFIDTNNEIIQLSKFSDMFPLLELIGNETVITVTDILPEIQSGLDNIANYVIFGTDEYAYFPTDTTFFTPDSLSYNPDNDWSLDLHSWYIHPSITLSPLDNGNIVLTWNNKIAVYNGDLNDLELIEEWNFSQGSNVEEWKRYTPENQWSSLYYVIWDSLENSLKVELYNSTWGWKTIRSPFVASEYGKYYYFKFKIRGENAHQIQFYIKEFDGNKTLIEDSFFFKSDFKGATFDWNDFSIGYSPKNESTQYIQLQIWHGHETDQPLPNVLWLKDCEVYRTEAEIIAVDIDLPLEIEKTDTYKIFLRYFKNDKGGSFKTYLDERVIEIQTRDKLDEFVWQELFTTNLDRGRHELRLENIKGLNAVDKIAIVTESDYKHFLSKLGEYLERKTLIYAMNSEEDLYYNKAEISDIFGIQTCDGNVLEISPGGSAWQTVHIFRDGYYKIGLKLKGRLMVQIDNSTIVLYSKELNYNYSDSIYLNQGKYDLNILSKSYENSSIWTFDNEENINEWKKLNSENQFNSINKIIWDEDKQALKALLYNSTWGWKTLNSPFVSIEQSKKYNYLFKIKGENAHQIQLYIREFDRNKTLIEDSFYYMPHIGDGTFDWKNVTLDYNPKNNATKYLQLQIWYGHETNKPLPNIIWLKNFSFSEYSSIPSYLDTMFLYSVNSSESKDNLENIFSNNEKTSRVISFEKLNPSLWRAEIEANEPFILSFLEGFDPHWVAYVNNQEYNPIKLYSTVNGFLINQTGVMAVIIKYKPQELFDIGLIISISTFILSIGLILLNWQNNNRYIKIIVSKIKNVVNWIACLKER